MKNNGWVVLLFLFGVALRAYAQDSVDSLRFCNPSNWKIEYKEPNLTVRSFRSDPGRESSFLFAVPQQIFVVTIDTAAFRIALAQGENKMKVSQLAKSQEAICAVNGGFFFVHPETEGAAVASDFLKIEGVVRSPEITSNGSRVNAAIGTDHNGKISYTRWNKSMETGEWQARFPNVIAAGPMLILNGIAQFGYVPIDKQSLDEQKKHEMYAPRTAIGSTADGKIVLLVIDGRQKKAFGTSYEEMALIGKWLGLTDMMNLDGGGSSTMICRGRLVNFPSDWKIIPVQRKVANGVLVVPR